MKYELAQLLVKQFSELATRVGLTCKAAQSGEWEVVEPEDDLRATITVTTGGTILVRHAPSTPQTPAIELPLRTNAIKPRLEGTRDAKNVPPGTEPWQVEPRSAMSLLTETVLHALEGKAPGKSSQAGFTTGRRRI